ncbi:alpha/beta fold hydrolase [Methanobacterium oryzae]|uniref:alpha/beta fold hydrolase n=1 Tax=Methanobacterium oryzae TaxID=69540 RepID=UPI003D1F1476
MLKPQNYTIKDFKFTSGASLPKLNVEYATFGTKIVDKEGNIINGILYLHGSSGDYSSVKRIKDILGPGNLIDTDKYFIICPTALGSPGSSSPSSSNLGHKFPKYNIEDMVNVQYCFLNEALNIKLLKGIIGTSMGGFLTLQWAVTYPDFMDFIIPITTSSNVKGQNYAINNLMNRYIKSDPEYNEGKYEINPKTGTQNASMFLYLFGFSPEYYKGESNEAILESLDYMKKEGILTDANDIVWRNEASNSYDLTQSLSKIKAKTLIIGVNQDQYFPPDIDVIPLAESIEGSKLYLYDSILGHLGSSEIIKADGIIKEFLDEIYK